MGHPTSTLLEYYKVAYATVVVPLYKVCAIGVLGDWRLIGPILRQNPKAVGLAITTSLHARLMVTTSSVVHKDK